ncbi:MAG: YitT family protein, partial [Acutalibacteraceae bacterium]|nr:YitT family protein [Acutalibacteraceae bacterium]
VSLTLDISEKYIKAFSGDIILCALFGGILVGLGLGIVILRGATTGGVDIIGKFVNFKYPHISIGKVILFGDAVVVATSAICYRDFSGALYSGVTMFVTSVVLDRVLYGADKGKLVYIITDNAAPICDRILTQISRGVTKINASGAYTGKEKEILMCAVRRQEVSLIHSLVKAADNEAFIIVCEAGEILGRGFKQ